MDTGWTNRNLQGIQYRYIYDGPICIQEVTESSTSFPPYAQSSDAQLNAYGATAIAQCAPTKPTANLATSLLEVYREGLPKLIGKDLWSERTQSAMALPKASGGEFLNYQFGVLPLVADIQDFVKAVRNLDRLLQQFARDNGNVVRRRFVFKPTIDVVESVVRSPTYPRLGRNGAPQIDFNRSPVGRVLRRRETTINRWFSGAFVYHLPQTFFAKVYSEFAADFQIYRRIFGLDLTPEVIWELAPWSWAVDWFSNVGDVIHNASAWSNNGLVMKYGYIMEHSIVRDTYTYVGPTNIIGSSARPPDATFVSEAKVRRAANPFGFGLTMGALTNTQKAILAALGLTRLR